MLKNGFVMYAHRHTTPYATDFAIKNSARKIANAFVSFDGG